jgi:hypothetical protein
MSSEDDDASLALGFDPLTHEFDQQKTLAPLPYPKYFRLSELVDGIEVGDAAFDALPMNKLFELHKTGVYPPMTLPSWADRAACRRGQKLHLDLFLCFLTGLTSGLLHGMVVGRFSEVLSLAGYAKDDWTTFYRYRDTSNAIYSWMAYDLFDERSPARQNLVRVRAMHTVARRSVRGRWDALAARDPNAIGVPLSQYDLALVQMAFCAMTLYFVEHHSMVTLGAKAKADYCHLWRVLGHMLGIEDRYNIATDAAVAERMFAEFLAIVPLLNKSVRPCCTALARGTVDGFGVFTVASKAFFLSLLYGAELRIPHLSAAWVGVKPPNPRYAAFVISQLDPTSWWLGGTIWHFLFAFFVHLQLVLPRVMHWIEVGSSYLPQALKF